MHLFLYRHRSCTALSTMCRDAASLRIYTCSVMKRALLDPYMYFTLCSMCCWYVCGVQKQAIRLNDYGRQPLNSHLAELYSLTLMFCV